MSTARTPGTELQVIQRLGLEPKDPSQPAPDPMRELLVNKPTATNRAGSSSGGSSGSWNSEAEDLCCATFGDEEEPTCTWTSCLPWGRRS